MTTEEKEKAALLEATRKMLDESSQRVAEARDGTGFAVAPVSSFCFFLVDSAASMSNFLLEDSFLNLLKV